MLLHDTGERHKRTMRRVWFLLAGAILLRLAFAAALGYTIWIIGVKLT